MTGHVNQSTATPANSNSHRQCWTWNDLVAAAVALGSPEGEIRAWVDRIEAMPTETFLAHWFGPGQAVYDQVEDLWIVPDPTHRGPGFGFAAFRPDKTWFTGVLPECVLQ